MIQVKDLKKQFTVADLVELDGQVQTYRRFFEQLEWDAIPERNEQRPWPGRQQPHPQCAYVKALLVKLVEGLTYMTDLRRYLVNHPLLVLALGFVPLVDEKQVYGFDVEATVPSARWLRHKLQMFPNQQFQQVLAATIARLCQRIPELGQSVALDCKHIYAWVCENNPKARVEQRYQALRQPKGDKECRLGVKRRSNQSKPEQAEAVVTSEALWGYASGALCSYHPNCGHVAIAEHTLPFNRTDVEFFPALYEQMRHNLAVHPQVLMADAAFDAWYVYEPFAQNGGLAAIPLNSGRFAIPQQGAQGLPLCPYGLEMPAYGNVYFDRTRDHHVQRHRCPLLVPRTTGERCAHPQFVKGHGCEKRLNTEKGGQMRITLDRQSVSYKEIYRKRVIVEQLFSQVTALGMERPKVRNLASVRNLNTLTYTVINVRALLRAPKAPQPAHSPLLC